MIFKKMTSATNSIMDKIHNHPFNKELSAGSLPKEKFIYYLAQDALYLLDFSKALALTAARLSNNDQAQQFICNFHLKQSMQSEICILTISIKIIYPIC